MLNGPFQVPVGIAFGLYVLVSHWLSADRGNYALLASAGRSPASKWISDLVSDGIAFGRFELRRARILAGSVFKRSLTSAWKLKSARLPTHLETS